ncbi:MAG: PP0621 family protein [Campylobacterota bacterium]|nr:PP0621 family protein [Campylobacterota bacterium]
MILKLIFLAIVLIGAYKLLGGKFPSLKSKDEKKIEEDTLVECEECGTFVTTKEAIIAKGRYYCSLECANRA